MKTSGPWGLQDKGDNLRPQPVASVLLVDDDFSKRVALKAVLEPLDLRIVEADSGEGALRRVMEEDFAVILLDVRMPEIDGFETAALIRRRKESELTPIIFITAFASDEIGSKARYVEGAVDFMFTPVPPHELRAKVSVFVNLHLKAEEFAWQAREVQASADQLRLLTDVAPIGIFRTDSERRFVYTNPRWSELTGVTSDEAFGKDWEAILHSMDPPGGLLDGLPASLGAGVSRRFQVTLPDRSARVVTMASEPIVDPVKAVTGWVGTLSDVTAEAGAHKERREAESERLLLLEEQRSLASQLRMLLDSTGEGIFGLDDEGVCTFMNKSGADLLRGTSDQFVGKRIHELIHHSDPDGSPCLDGDCLVHRGLVTGESTSVRGELLWRLDGLPLPVDLSSHPIGEGGLASGAVVAFQDVTERDANVAAKERLEGELVQAQKMEAVGQLAGGIAHDFNNLLSVILNYADFASEGMDRDDPRLRDINEISKAGEKATTLVHQLLAFSRKEVVERRIIDLNEVVRGIYSILSRSLGEDIDLSFRAADDLPTVSADPGRIEQVLLNLAVNARDAMPEGGKLTISTGVEMILDDCPPVRPGQYVLITVSDTGLGMDAATMERIFDPFFTTKPRGEGTGMGLSSAHGILEQAGGCLRVTSALGAGTTFTLFLPACAESSTVPRAVIQAAPIGGSEHILLVEDEDALREVASRILKKHGYEVAQYSNGAEAIDYCRSNFETIDLLLTDVVMPEMSGKEVSKQASAICGGLKTLFMSGYTDELIAQRGGLTASENLISKPFDAKQLLLSVRSLLDKQVLV